MGRIGVVAAPVYVSAVSSAAPVLDLLAPFVRSGGSSSRGGVAVPALVVSSPVGLVKRWLARLRRV